MPPVDSCMHALIIYNNLPKFSIVLILIISQEKPKPEPSTNVAPLSLSSSSNSHPNILCILTLKQQFSCLLSVPFSPSLSLSLQSFEVKAKKTPDTKPNPSSNIRPRPTLTSPKTQNLSLMDSPKPTRDFSSSVDTSRPFRSVKEAVAIFGERILVGDIYSSTTPKPYEETTTPWSPPSPSFKSPDNNDDREVQQVEEEKGFVESLKKLEAELEETKAELKLLKERESETEIALASLNAELHKNMSKMASAEATAAAKKAVAANFGGEGERKDGLLTEEEKMRRDLIMRMEDSQTLSQILSFGEEKGYFGKEEKKMMKKKPIVPLVGDLWFFRKKGSSNDNALHNSLYASPHLYFN